MFFDLIVSLLKVNSSIFHDISNSKAGRSFKTSNTMNQNLPKTENTLEISNFSQINYTPLSS
jgi:hypothetical protein